MANSTFELLDPLQRGKTMDQQTVITRRVAAAHAFAAGHPVIGIGAQLRSPFDAITRELVVIHTILDGTVYQQDRDIQEAVNRYASRYEDVIHG